MSLYDSVGFEEFWRVYAGMHARPATQRMHAVASLAFLGVIAAAIVLRRPALALLAPLADHAIAQASHRIFEKNRTMPWKNPLWHSRAEFRMLGRVLRGQPLLTTDRRSCAAAPAARPRPCRERGRASRPGR